MKNFKKIACTLLAGVISAGTLMFSGCIQLANGDMYITHISDGGVSNDGSEYIFTAVLSNGDEQEIRIPIAEKGEAGKDGKDLSITEIYKKYVEEYGETDYAEFLKEYSSGAEISDKQITITDIYYNDLPQYWKTV